MIKGRSFLTVSALFIGMVLAFALTSCGGGGGGSGNPGLPFYTFNATITGTSPLSNWSHSYTDSSACWGYRKSQSTQQVIEIYIYGSNGSYGLEIRAPSSLAQGVYQNIRAYFYVPDTEDTGPLSGTLTIDAVDGTQINFRYNGSATIELSEFSASVGLSSARRIPSRCVDVFI